MFTIEPGLIIDAARAATIELSYTAPAPRETTLTFTVASGEAQILAMSIALLDGTTIAVPLTHRASGARRVTTVALGYVAESLRISMTMQAVVPVQTHDITLEAADDDTTITISMRLAAGPKFVAGRSRLHFPDGEPAPGAEANLEVSLVNDGTAIATGAHLELRLPPWVTAEAAGAWRELQADHPILVVPLAEIGVGASHMLRSRIGLAPVVADGAELVFEAVVAVGEARFPLEPLVIGVRSSAKVGASVKLSDARTYRYGERVAAIVVARGRGSDVTREVRLTVESAAIAWDESSGLPLTLDFGDVPPMTDSARLIEGTIIAAPGRGQTFPVRLSGHCASGSIDVRGCELAATGAARVRASLDVEELAAERAYAVRCVVRNVGDGEASAVVVRARSAPGIVGVVDSLVVDGQRRFALDGSVAVEHAGLAVGPLGIRAERDIRWTVRSGIDQTVALTVDVDVDGEVHTIEAAPRWFAAGVRGDEIAAIVPAAPGEDATGVPSPAMATTSGTEETEEAKPAHSDDAAGAVSGTPAVTFEIGPSTLERWTAWFGEDGPTPTVELARYVLAAREFLPARATANLELLLATLRSEADAVVVGRLLSWKNVGLVGASGFDFSTPKLRMSLASFWNAIGTPQEDLSGVRLDQAIVALTAAAGTPFADEVATFRDRLLATLDLIKTTEDYRQAAPAIAPAAAALFAAMRQLAVAA